MTAAEEKRNLWFTAGELIITSDDVLLELKLGEAPSLLASLLERKTALALAAERRLTVAPEEVEQALDDFFAERGMFEAEDSEAWLLTHSLTEAVLRRRLAESVLMAQLRREMVPDSAVQRHFSAHQPDYGRAEVERYAFRHDGVAREFMLAVREGEAAAQAGEQLSLRRSEAPESLAALMFASEAGDLLGPVGDESGAFHVYRLLGLCPAELDDELRESIRDQLFAEALAAHRGHAQLSAVR